MHPVANVGISYTLAQACTAILLYLIGLAGVVPPENVVEAVGVLNAIVVGYVIYKLTRVDPDFAAVVGGTAPPGPARPVAATPQPELKPAPGAPLAGSGGAAPV